jgi:hypothetical protein
MLVCDASVCICLCVYGCIYAYVDTYVWLFMLVCDTSASFSLLHIDSVTMHIDPVTKITFMHIYTYLHVIMSQIHIHAHTYTYTYMCSYMYDKHAYLNLSNVNSVS